MSGTCDGHVHDPESPDAVRQARELFRSIHTTWPAYARAVESTVRNLIERAEKAERERRELELAELRPRDTLTKEAPQDSLGPEMPEAVGYVSLWSSGLRVFSSTPMESGTPGLLKSDPLYSESTVRNLIEQKEKAERERNQWEENNEELWSNIRIYRERIRELKAVRDRLRARITRLPTQPEATMPKSEQTKETAYQPHPFPWRVEHDWMLEIRDANGDLVVKGAPSDPKHMMYRIARAITGRVLPATPQQEPEGDVDELRHALDCGHESEVCEWPRCSCAESVLRQWDATRVQPRTVEGRHCPTCGTPVRVVSADEGTSYYEPIQPRTVSEEEE